MKVTGTKFSEPGEEGDFGWMINSPDYADALFIFNDNEEQFRAYVTDPTPGSPGCSAGGGNAVIRPFRCADPPRAAGVPTGSGGAGYAELTDEVRGVLDEALAIVKDLVASGRYKEVIYSSANREGDLGTGIFHVGEDVKQYIVAELRKLAD